MSYLAFDLDSLKMVPDTARAAGLPEEALGYGLVRLWSYCWTVKTAVVKRAHLRGFFGGVPDRVEEALEAFGFVSAEGEGADGWYVAEAERYLRITEARKKGGEASKGNLVPGGPKGGGEKPQPSTTLGSSSAPAESQPSIELGCASALTPSTEHRESKSLKALSAKTPTAAPLAVNSAGPPEEPPSPPGPPPNSTDQPPRAEQAREVFRHWCERFKKRLGTEFDGKRHRAVDARLKAGHSVADLKRAIDGCAASAWHRGQNDRGKEFTDLELICRDAKHVEEFCALADCAGPEPNPCAFENCGSPGGEWTEFPGETLCERHRYKLLARRLEAQEAEGVEPWQETVGEA